MTKDKKQIYNPCPKCGSELEMGFGLAGGGYGAYEYCTNEKCDQFTKWQEHDDEQARAD
jgi:hypothetical protein